MDRNTVIGLVLIGALLILWTVFNRPSAEQQAHQKHIQDSIAFVHKADSLSKVASADTTTLKKDTTTNSSSASLTTNVIAPNASLFHDSLNNSESFLTIENDLMKVTLSNKGGRVYSVELKKYKTYDAKPLVLFDGENSGFNYSFFSGNIPVNTSDIFFKTENTSASVKKNDSATIVFRAGISSNKFFEQSYTLHGGSYLIDYKVRLVGLDSVVALNTDNIQLSWLQKPINTESSMPNNRTVASVYYKMPDEDATSLSLTKDAEEKVHGNIEWVCFKQHFFNSTLIGKGVFIDGTITDTTKVSDKYVKNMTADFTIPYKHGGQNNYAMQMYFGPNDYRELKSHGIGLEGIIPLGSGIFYWFAAPINKWFILPLFHFLNSFIANYGIIILIMTILIRVITLPFTYKSMVSAAKMKVLKPEIDELKEKYKDDQGRFGQEQLKLFRQAGVNPLGGCLPLLLQLPILVAMYSLFPISIELRQQSFLWAKDLTAYDSIWNFPNGFSIPFYGDHVSLFTLLMTVSQIVMAVYMSQMNNATGQMKWMQYIFPIMLLGIFNNLSAALTYYYFLFNLLSIIMQWVVTKYMIDEKAIHAQIQENKKKGPKKSGFMSRLEEMQKKQQAAQRERSRR